MRLKTKRISIAGLSAVCALSVVAGASLLAVGNEKTALAENTAVPTSVYYYDNLTDTNGKEYTLAKKFYNVLDAMNKNGDFKDGVVDYDLKDMLTSAQIKAWVSDGDLTVPKAFSAARDSYYYDHPELFYIDMYKISLSAGRIDDNYVAYIDCGREANLYAEGGFTSESQVNTAIAAYEAKVNEVAEYAETEAQKDTCGIAKEVLLARYANSYIAEHTKYDDKSLNDFIQDSSSVTTGSVSQTAYGALVAGTAVCNGYSRAYKAVMDKLKIPCIVVGGYSVSKNSQGEDATKNSSGKIDNMGEPHAWNYVWYVNPVIKEEMEEGEAQAAAYANGQGSWYSYDVTWNSTNNKSTLTYCDMGALSDGKNHIADGEVSSSGYILKYPQLSTFNYGCATATNGLSRVGVYVADDSDGLPYDDYGNPKKILHEYISFNGKGADKLLNEDGLHIIFRYQGRDTGNGGDLYWSKWASVSNTCTAFGIEGDENPYQSMIPAFYTGLYSQFAVTDLDPDLNEIDNTKTKYYYTDEELLAEHIIDITGLYENKTYGTYLSAPHVVSTTPKPSESLIIRDSMIQPGTSMMKESEAFTLSITYNEPLHILNENEPIGVTYTTRVPISNLSQYTKFVPVNDNGDLVEISQDGKTLTFKFMPSLMYEHNRMLYSFQFTNVGSNAPQYDKNGNKYTTDKLPNSAPFVFSRSVMFCPKIFNDGRLWVDCCAVPTLVSDSNLAEMQFKDDSGSTFTSSMSQMMLVVENVSDATKNEMLNGIKDIKDSNVTRDDIKKSETYDIDLQHCGRYATIPDGSYVKISLGFPEGYGPESEGVTFKIYHRKHVQGDEYIIEEVPCVVTKLGIVATVKSFSPYMIAAVDAAKVSSDKYIYATVVGRGGKLSNEDGEIKTVKEGGNVSFAITPDEGYQIYKVTLNDKVITDKVVNGQLSLTYAELDSNSEIEIQYIANAAAQRLAEKAEQGVVVVDPVKVYVPVEDRFKNYNTSGNPGGKNNVGLIVGIVVVVAVLAIGGAAVAFVVIRKKQPAKVAASTQPKAKKAQKPVTEKQTGKVPANVAKATAVAAAEPTKAPAKPVATAQPKTAAKPAATTAAKPATAAKPTATVKPAAKPVTKPTTKPTSKK